MTTGQGHSVADMPLVKGDYSMEVTGPHSMREVMAAPRSLPDWKTEVHSGVCLRGHFESRFPGGGEYILPVSNTTPWAGAGRTEGQRRE